MNADPAEIADLLAEVMSGALGRGVQVDGVARLKGGYSRQMWAFDAVDRLGRRSPWILCTDSPAGVVGDDSLSRRDEARLIEHVHRGGLPVPAIATIGAGVEPFGAGWFVMQRLVGTAAVGPLVRDEVLVAQRRTLGRRKAEILAAIHALPIPPDAFGELPPADRVARLETERWRRALVRTPTADTAAMRSAVDFLRVANPAPSRQVCIVHGDYRTGNLLYDQQGAAGITGVLDWEMAHPGDPLEDVAWAQLAAWRVGTGLVGALLTDDEWLADYAAAAHIVVDPDSLTFWHPHRGEDVDPCVARGRSNPAG